MTVYQAIQEFLVDPCKATSDRLQAAIQRAFDAKLITHREALALATQFRHF